MLCRVFFKEHLVFLLVHMVVSSVGNSLHSHVPLPVYHMTEWTNIPKRPYDLTRLPFSLRYPEKELTMILCEKIRVYAVSIEPPCNILVKD